MADVASGETLYSMYSEVSEEVGGWLSLRDIVLSRKMARRMLVQPLTVIQGIFSFSITIITSNLDQPGVNHIQSIIMILGFGIVG